MPGQVSGGVPIKRTPKVGLHAAKGQAGSPGFENCPGVQVKVSAPLSICLPCSSRDALVLLALLWLGLS